MWQVPIEFTDELVHIARQLECNWLGLVSVNSHIAYEKNNCHNSTMLHSSIYGGESIIGWYFVSGFRGIIQAVRHSMYYNNGCYTDIVPYADKRTVNMFGRSRNQLRDYSIKNLYFNSAGKYMQETQLMYYVYQLVDPRTNQPFYIGKGKGNRAKTHLWEIPDTRNQYKENKIADIRSNGLEPKIEYIAENIPNEELAYDMEKDLIAYYGRKGYDPHGILTNICLDSRPPNHKGKSYKEIYGNRWQEEIEKRRQKQLERGGFGPKKHTNETKEKIKQGVIFAHANRDCSHNQNTKDLIGVANSKFVGKLNKKSKKYILISPTNEIFELYGGELRDFCLKNNLSLSTLKKHLYKNSIPPKYGKTKGWKLQ